MQVLCIASDDAADMQCEVCGQRYQLYFTRFSEAERAKGVAQVAATLKRHHGQFGDTRSAHPRDSFNVPEWSGLARMSAAALLGGGPGRE